MFDTREFDRRPSGLAQALLAAQQDFPQLLRDAENSHFKSKYVSLSALLGAVLPVLHKHGLVLIQHPTTLEGQPALRTQIVHAESDTGAESTMLLLASKSDPQGQGSALTYARRYMVEAMLGLAASDDDGNTATASRQREASEGDRKAKMNERIFALCEALDAMTKQQPGSWRSGVEEAARRDFGVAFSQLQPGELEEIGKYLKAQQEKGITEAPEKIDWSVPF